jgi:hypothetical protein
MEDVISWINDLSNAKTLEYAVKFWAVNNNHIKFYAIIVLLKNGKEVSQDILGDVAKDIEYAEKLLKKLEENNCADKYPSKYANQQLIAKSNLINWLKYPTELGELPQEIEYLDTIEKNGCCFYLFKFNSNKEAFKEKGWILGISGGYEKGKLTSSSTGATFSRFEPVSEDYIKQGNDIIDFIQNYWKERAKGG